MSWPEDPHDFNGGSIIPYLCDLCLLQEKINFRVQVASPPVTLMLYLLFLLATLLSLKVWQQYIAFPVLSWQDH